jgi:predicted nucleic acid-binding protein
MIVFDASTLILITKIEVLDLFLAGSQLAVAIPIEVEKECCAGRTLDALMIQRALKASKIKTLEVRNKKPLAKLRADFALGGGEAEAIALALEKRATLIGIDDKNGISACKLLGIPFTTAIGILIRACEKKLLSLPEAQAKLAVLGIYGRYKQSILEDARQKLEATA